MNKYFSVEELQAIAFRHFADYCWDVTDKDAVEFLYEMRGASALLSRIDFENAVNKDEQVGMDDCVAAAETYVYRNNMKNENRDFCKTEECNDCDNR